MAALKGTQDCLLFPTGFAANMAVVTALGSGADAVVFSDELNHASIVDGSRLAVRNKVVHCTNQTVLLFLAGCCGPYMMRSK